MRDIRDNRNNISELQRYLRELHHDSGGIIPLVNPDGIYGPETAAAVMAFQERAGLPPTGETDNATWNAIYREYTNAIRRRSPPHSISPFPNEEGYEISEGEYSDIVAIVQFMLRLLANAYDDIDGLPPDGVYNEATIKDIMTFQKRHGLPITGRVDKDTWDELADAYNRISSIYN